MIFTRPTVVLRCASANTQTLLVKGDCVLYVRRLAVLVYPLFKQCMLLHVV
jgi:hypothetical protein